MKIIFFGSAKFGSESLKGLIEAGYEIPLVVTQADKQKGRGLKLGNTPIKDLAQAERLKIFQPENINAPDSLSLLRSLEPDLFVIIAYGQKLSSELLAIPKILPINVHASLLPKYRGAAPINWAIINGDKQTGNTIMKVILKMDAGPIISQSRVAIEDTDDSLSIEEKLSQDSRILLLRAVKEIETQNYKLIEQEEVRASIAPKLDGKITEINWNEPADKIYNLVRGCANWSAAFTKYKDKIIKIHKAQLENSGDFEGKFSPGEIIEVKDSGIIIATGKGALIIKELQFEGKKRLFVKEFLSGSKMLKGEKFEN